MGVCVTRERTRYTGSKSDEDSNMAFENISIMPEPTPNPNSVRFVIHGRPVMPRGTADFQNAEDAERSIVAAKLFALGGVSGVFLGPNFVTVTSASEEEWNHLATEVLDLLGDTMKNEEVLIEGDANDQQQTGDQSEVVSGIIEIIDNEIRPAVAMDGGDIIFGKYENGIVHLHLRGACSGCPSSTATLKMGIERRLQEAFPEIIGVEAMA